MGKRNVSIENKILNNIKINEATNCWEWQEYCFPNGYGEIWVPKKSRLVHRAAFEAFIGPIPVGLCVCHHCDNPKCVNPDHLFLGTHTDNMQDMLSKGRQGKRDHHVPHPNMRGPHPNMRGSKHSQAKLTDADVIEIKILLTKGEFQRIIAEKFSVSQSAISLIKTGINWSHI